MCECDREPERPIDAAFLGEFSHDDVLYSYGVIESFLTMAPTGLYFAHWADEGSDQSVYIVVPITEDDAKALKDNTLPIREALERGGRWFWVNEMWRGEPKIRAAEFARFEDIPTDVLPVAGVGIRP